MATESDMLELIESLTLVIQEETDRLEAGERASDLAALAAAKARLVSSLEVMSARAERKHPEWIEQLGDEARQKLADTFSTLKDVSLRNAYVLERQISLSQEMMDAVAAELRRLTGKSISTYDELGELGRTEMPAPISINTQF